MSNPNNSGNIIGHLAADPKIITHSNGTSGTALVTVYANDNYVTTSSGERESVRVDLEQYLADVTRPGAFGFLRKGMLVSVNYGIANNDHRDAAGQMVYGMKLNINRGGLQVLDSKQAAAQREAAQAQPQAQPQSSTFDQAQAFAQNTAPQAAVPNNNNNNTAFTNSAAADNSAMNNDPWGGYDQQAPLPQAPAQSADPYDETYMPNFAAANALPANAAMVEPPF